MMSMQRVSNGMFQIQKHLTACDRMHSLHAESTTPSKNHVFGDLLSSGSHIT